MNPRRRCIDNQLIGRPGIDLDISGFITCKAIGRNANFALLWRNDGFTGREPGGGAARLDTQIALHGRESCSRTIMAQPGEVVARCGITNIVAGLVGHYGNEIHGIHVRIEHVQIIKIALDILSPGSGATGFVRQT